MPINRENTAAVVRIIDRTIPNEPDAPVKGRAQDWDRILVDRDRKIFQRCITGFISSRWS